MTPSVEPLLTLWAELNRRYFQNALPPIPIQWSRRLTSSAGMFVCRVGPRHILAQNSINPTPRRCIRLSAVLLPVASSSQDHETVTTLAHEMIHQWQYDVLKRRPNHGQDFRRMMARMNHDGLGITIYHSLTTEVAALAKYAWRCQQCGSIYRRQRRTIQPRRHLCGACKGPLREFAVAREEPQREPAPVSSIGRQFSLPFHTS